MSSEGEYVMLQWPVYVYMAADRMGYNYDEPDGVAAIEMFATRWDGFGPGALIRAQQGASGEEWEFAMELLISSAAPHARELVAPDLASTNSVTRWYSALYLGVLEDRRAVSVLSAMLTEFLPLPNADQPDSSNRYFYDDVRPSIAYILGKIGDPACIPSLRHALLAVIQIERGQTRPQGDAPEIETINYQNTLRALRRYQDRLVYTLGRFGSFGALTGLVGGEDRIPLWRIHLIMGHLHGRYALATMGAFEDEPALVADITALLGKQFGLTATEQERELKAYSGKMFFTISTLYQAEKMERERHLDT